MKRVTMKEKTGRATGRATHDYKKAKNLLEKFMVANQGRFRGLGVFDLVRAYLSPPNARLYHTKEKVLEFANNIEKNLSGWFLRRLQKKDFKGLYLLASAVEHFSRQGVGAVDAVGKHILMAYEDYLKQKKALPTKRELYDYFFDNLDYKTMHFEDFCHRLEKLHIPVKKTKKRFRPTV